MKSLFPAWLILGCLLSGIRSVAGQASAPNIICILADDLGYGDLKCLNPKGRIATPQLDRLATEGMIFTDAHSSSAVCTPSRYSLLTGRYAWRSSLQQGVLGGYGKPLIPAGRLTLPGLLRERGYTTACIGKWHLGMTLPERPEAEGKIADSPVTRGFDEFFGISASLDMPPYAFIRNDRFTAPLDTEKELFKGRRGPAASDFTAEAVLPELTRQAVGYIKARAAGEKPFFLYLALTSPHTPIVPAKEWQGKSGLGSYGDFVMQTDAAVGEVLAALEGTGAADRTLVLFTADNGFAPAGGTGALEKQGHDPSGPFRGYKSDIWEGGHRVPFLVRWPERIKAGSRSGALVCLGDLMATCAQILQVELPGTACEDSVSFLPALTGSAGETGRGNIVHHSINGCFAIRQGEWKLNLCPGSGGWGKPTDPAAARQGLPEVQLYNLLSDPGETTNRQADHPERVIELTQLLEQQIANGRSTPGEKQPNDVRIVLRKSPAGSSGKGTR